MPVTDGFKGWNVVFQIIEQRDTVPHNHAQFEIYKFYLFLTYLYIDHL